MLTLSLLLSACANSADPAELPEPTATEAAAAPVDEAPSPEPANEESDISAGYRRESFDELGFSLLIADDLSVEKNPVPLEGQEGLELYTFFIQPLPGEGSADSYFQIYGLIQFSTPEITWEELSQAQDETEAYSYVEPIEFNGLQGFETQLIGERSNFVFLFYLEKHLLRIAVSDPTQENLARTKEILATLEWLD